MKTKRKPRPITLLPDPDSITIHLCPVCRGEKVCPYCHNYQGQVIALGEWVKGCADCNYTGQCPRCQGRGWV